jgi:DNA-binding FadR family transcriptional regulator
MNAQTEDLARVREYLDQSRRAKQIRLPPEGKLSDELGIARSRLRVLLKRLEAEGLIWRQVGKGTFLGQRSTAMDLSTLATMINPLEAMEARFYIEPALSGLAANRATAKEIDEMYECLHKMETLTIYHEWVVWDEKLHRLVAKAARNTLLLAVYDAVREAIPESMRTRLEQVNKAAPKAADPEHRLYVDAIRDGDAHLAETLMRDHLIAIRKRLFGDR